MGATDFYTTSHGNSAKSAFNEAVDEAQDLEGSDGYTGTIAEKDSFVMINLPDGEDPWAYAEELIDDGGRGADKYGPAGCIEVSEGEYLFFGMASS